MSRRHRPVARLGGVVAAVALALTGCTSAAPAPAPASSPPAASGAASGGGSSGPLARFTGQHVTWTSCAGQFRCARVQVPVDYARPGGPVTSIAVLKLPASDPSRRLGTLFINPGGPGGSGVEYALSADQVVSAQVRERYDVVGFDPRGVGESDPVRCQSDAQTDAWLSADGSPDDAAETQQLVELSRRLGQLCEQRDPQLLPHVGTVDVARDLDVLRAVVGDRRLTYLGKSYGTLIGAVYAGLFPQRVGRVVLDGALAPDLSQRELDEGQAGGFQLALDSFADDCARDATCSLGRTRAAVESGLQELLGRVDADPLPTSTARRLTQSLAVTGVVAALYSQSSWPVLRTAIALAESGDGSGLLQLSDAYTERGPGGHYADNGNDVIYAVDCLDRPGGGGLAGARAELPALQRLSPVFGAYLAYSSLPCATWPVRAAAVPQRVTAAGAAPIVVIGTTRDPATPYAWAQRLADQLSSGRLITYVGDGHTAYRRSDACVDDAVDAFWLDGTAPRDGLRC